MHYWRCWTSLKDLNGGLHFILAQLIKPWNQKLARRTQCFQAKWRLIAWWKDYLTKHFKRDKTQAGYAPTSWTLWRVGGQGKPVINPQTRTWGQDIRAFRPWPKSLRSGSKAWRLSPSLLRKGHQAFQTVNPGTQQSCRLRARVVNHTGGRRNIQFRNPRCPLGVRND